MYERDVFEKKRKTASKEEGKEKDEVSDNPFVKGVVEYQKAREIWGKLSLERGEKG